MGKKMALHKPLILIALLSLILSCAQKPNKAAKEIKRLKKELDKSIVQTKRQEAESLPLSQPLPPPVLPETYAEVDPFEGRAITLSAANAPLRQVLYTIAKGSGLNLILAPEVNPNLQVTANFENVPAKEALQVIMDMTGLYYEIRGNVLYVRGIMTKTFKLPHVNVVPDYTSSLGGDVLGSSLSAGVGGFGGTALSIGGGFGGLGGFSGTGGLRGNYSVNFKATADDLDFYKQLEENVKALLSDNGSYVLNRFTGTLVVTDWRANVEAVENLIKRLVQEVKKQVLIEAKIVEIALRDEFQYGIDWNRLFRDIFKTKANVTITQSLSLPDGGYATLSVVSMDFGVVINALARYGKVHALSNPRIMVSNGQPALIATGIITPFFERTLTTVTGTAVTQLQQSITRTNVLEGLLLGVIPKVEEDGTILMNIVPVSTRLEGTKTFEISGDVVAEAPILNIKEAGTTVRVRSGDLVVIGGLISEAKGFEERKVPGLGDIPFLGVLFKSKRVFKEKRELIIFLRPVLVQNSGNL